ncbi:MAG: hypothetical protein QXI16_02890 [Sulfolobaceae archaeon]
MGVAELFRSKIREARKLVKENNVENYVLYISGSKKQKSMLEGMLEKWKIDNEIDYDLKITTIEEYNEECNIYKILSKSLKNYETF